MSIRKRNYTRLSIIQMVLNEEFTDIESIAEELGISRRTVQNNILKLDEPYRTMVREKLKMRELY